MNKYLPGFDFFSVGVNYWSSHAGISMWKNFSADEVEADFAALRAAGVNTVRIFPLWSDFQPVHLACEINNNFKEYAFPDGSPLPASGLRKYGIDPEMIEKFRIVANLAQKYDLSLIVALLTGWMSGAMFVPPALSGKNILTDFQALKLQKMFIDGFVSALKDHSAIKAWEPGNECNCMSSCDENAAWNWLNMVTSAIRLADPSRPVYAGMHGASDDWRKPFNLIQHQELCDAVTTHPYPAFTPHCGKSALNDIPAIYHATAETLFYAGVSGKPGFVEEIGAFGAGYLSDERTEQYLYCTLYSALVHNLKSVLWWCGFSFDRCSGQYPYRWCAMERGLGALNSDRTPAGAARAMKRFTDEMAALPEFSPRKVDAVVVLSELSDGWKTAYGSYILSKQAGFEVEYCSMKYIDQLPESNFYIVPAIEGFCVMDLAKYQLLLQAAEKGATVLFTADSGYLRPFAEYFGCEVEYCAETNRTVTFELAGEIHNVPQSITRQLKAVDCDVLAQDQAGNPVITCKKAGKGKLIYVNAPLENAALVPGNQLYKVYRRLAETAGLVLEEKSPAIGITHHTLADGRTIKFYINYSSRTADGIEPNGVKYVIE